MLILGTIASATRQGLSTTAFDSIETVIVSGSSTQSVSFSTISSAYSTLRILYNGNATPQGTDMYIRFNSDSGNNYYWHSSYGLGQGANAVMISQTPTNHLYLGYDNNIASTTANTIDVYLTDIKDTIKYKTGKYNSGYMNAAGSGNSFLFVGGGIWANASAITSIEFGMLNTSTKFRANSTISLYGIKD
jgi:hypothetical protein